MDVASLIITNGLGGNACHGFITTHFSLLCDDVPPKTGGGGPYPANMGAHNQFKSAQDIFTPVHQDLYDPDRVYKDKKQVTIKINIGDINVEKLFLVPINRAKIIVKGINIVNATRTKVLISVSKIKRVIHNITVKAKNLTRKKDK